MANGHAENPAKPDFSRLALPSSGAGIFLKYKINVKNGLRTPDLTVPILNRVAGLMSERSFLSRGLELRPTRKLTDGFIGSGLIAAVCVAAVPAFAGDVLPSNGTVTAGSASIVRTNPSTL